MTQRLDFGLQVWQGSADSHPVCGDVGEEGQQEHRVRGAGSRASGYGPWVKCEGHGVRSRSYLAWPSGVEGVSPSIFGATSMPSGEQGRPEVHATASLVPEMR